jgi:hypothetical protein
MFKMFVDLVRSGIDVVKHMQSGGNMEICWIMFDHLVDVLQWHATSVTTSIARFSLSHVVICKWKAPKPIWLFGII